MEATIELPLTVNIVEQGENAALVEARLAGHLIWDDAVPILRSYTEEDVKREAAERFATYFARGLQYAHDLDNRYWRDH